MPLLCCISTVILVVTAAEKPTLETKPCRWFGQLPFASLCQPAKLPGLSANSPSPAQQQRQHNRPLPSPATSNCRRLPATHFFFLGAREQKQPPSRRLVLGLHLSRRPRRSCRSPLRITAYRKNNGAVLHCGRAADNQTRPTSLQQHSALRHSSAIPTRQEKHSKNNSSALSRESPLFLPAGGGPTMSSPRRRIETDVGCTIAQQQALIPKHGSRNIQNHSRVGCPSH